MQTYPTSGSGDGEQCSEIKKKISIDHVVQQVGLITKNCDILPRLSIILSHHVVAHVANISNHG